MCEPLTGMNIRYGGIYKLMQKAKNKYFIRYLPSGSKINQFGNCGKWIKIGAKTGG